MKRCPHGFLAPAPGVKGVACPSGCHLAAAPRSSGKLRTGEQYNFVDMTGKQCAGATVVERAPNVSGNARWRCRCACGELFMMEGLELRRLGKRNRVARCDACKQGRTVPQALPFPVPPAPPPATPVHQPPPDPLRPGELRWWRFELDADGKVKSCTPVEHRGAEGETQFIYVQARDQKEAGRTAWNEHVRLETLRRRKRLVAEGKCPWCARENDRPAGKRCSVCLASEKRRERAQRRGAPTQPRIDALAARREDDRTRYRVEVLREVWQILNELDPRDFRAWLEQEANVQSKAGAAE